jgi:hypothetical protein
MNAESAGHKGTGAQPMGGEVGRIGIVNPQTGVVD